MKIFPQACVQTTRHILLFSKLQLNYHVERKFTSFFLIYVLARVHIQYVLLVLQINCSLIIATSCLVIMALLCLVHTISNGLCLQVHHSVIKNSRLISNVYKT